MKGVDTGLKDTTTAILLILAILAIGSAFWEMSAMGTRRSILYRVRKRKKPLL